MNHSKLGGAYGQALILTFQGTQVTAAAEPVFSEALGDNSFPSQL